MIARSDIGLGDLIRVVATLASDDDTARRLAWFLGFGDAVAPGESEPEPPLFAATIEEEPDIQIELELSDRDEPVVPLPRSGRSDEAHVLTPRPRRVDASLDAPLLPMPALPPPAGELAPDLSLFEPRWTRNLLAAAIATESDNGNVDVERLVDALARRTPMRELPRRTMRTQRRGAEVLVDRGEGMLPFRRDVEQLLKRLDGVVVGLAVRSFRGDPSRVYRRSPRQTEAHVPPPPRTPVVAIGDLGVTGTARKWLRWATRIAQHGCPVVIVTPVDRAEWPAPLARIATIIAWDRATTSSAVHRARARRRSAR